MKDMRLGYSKSGPCCSHVRPHSLVRLRVQDLMSGEKEYNVALPFTGGLCLIMTNIAVIIFRFYYYVTTL